MIPTSLLAEPSFRRLFAAHLVSFFGDRVVPVALAFAVLDLTGSVTDLGLVLAAQLVPLLLFLIGGGVWADRIARVPLMVASNLVRAVSQGVMAGLLIVGGAEVWHLVVLQLVHGMATAIYRPAASALIPDVVSEPTLQRANALLGLADNVTSILGPAAAGVLVATVGGGWAIGLDALSFVASAWLLRGVDARAATPEDGESLRRSVTAGCVYVRSRAWLWATIASASLLQLLVLSPMLVLGPLIAETSLGGASTWGLVLAGFGVGSIAGSLGALWWKPTRPLLASFVAIVWCGPTLALLAVGAPVALIVAAEVCSGAAIALFDTWWITALQRNVPVAMMARVASYDWLGSLALRPLGLALVGPVAGAVGVEATLIGAAALNTLLVLVPLGVPSIRQLSDTSRLAEQHGRSFASPAPAALGVRTEALPRERSALLID